MKERLIKFEEEVCDRFLVREIKAPVHLSKGNEDQLIELFKQVRESDWVFSTHRAHFHAILHGLTIDWLRTEILAGHSMHLFSRNPKLFTSSIVAGCLPIAVGVALAMKRKSEDGHVWVFVGDMGGETGAFHEATKYAARHDLPITFVVEDNGLSANTPTQCVWGTETQEPRIVRYTYENGYPHTGVGQWVNF